MPTSLFLKTPAKDRTRLFRETAHQLGSIRSAAASLGVSVSTARYYANGQSKAHREANPPEFTPRDEPADESAEEREGLHISRNADDLVINSVSKTIKTVEAAIAAAEVDTDVWEVRDYEISKHDQGTKIKVGKGVQRVLINELWRVRLKLRRKLTERAELAIKSLLDKVARAAIPSIRQARKAGDDLLLEMNFADVHFGKNARGAETGGRDYDLSTAETVYANAVHDTLSRIVEPVQLVVMPVGNDLIQVDNERMETTAGTRQNVSGQFKQIFGVAFESVRLSIVQAAQHAPVKVVWVPGNHDSVTSYMLAFALAQHFRNSRHVTFDVSEQSRKYHRHGINLIGWGHGDAVKQDKLPGLMAGEVPELWGATRVRSFHCGHEHRERQMVIRTGDTFGPVTVRVVPSLCEADYWHAVHGYVGTPTAAQAFIHSAHYGFMRMENVYARR